MRKNTLSAVIPGSFDPVTVGHLDLIRRAASMFDHVYVTVFRNAEKKGMFTDEEKLRMLELATADLDNVECCIDGGLTAAFAAEHGAVIVKGVRNGTDFDYEMNLAAINRNIDASVDTILLPAKQEYLHISSSFVREMIRYGHEFIGAVPQPVYDYLKNEWRK